jgi:hypothetical protein
MKTLYVTNVPCGNLDVLLGRFEEVNAKLPDFVRNEKLHQALTQISLLGHEEDAYGFYETSLDEGRRVNVNDPIGTISVRIDYNPNCVVDNKEPDWQPAEVFDAAIMALCRPNSHPQFPELGLIDHIRVAIKVADGVILEHTYWATQYYLIKGLEEECSALYGSNATFNAADYI